MLPALCRSDDAPRDELMNRDPEVRPWMSTILDCPGGASEMLYQPCNRRRRSPILHLCPVSSGTFWYLGSFGASNSESMAV